MSRIAFRPMTRADFPLLGRWLHAPHVQAWWPREPPTPADIEGKYGPRVEGRSPVRAFILEVDGDPVGMFQCFRYAEHHTEELTLDIPSAASFDCLIGEVDRCGHGVGSAAMAAFGRLVLDLYPDAAALVGYPRNDNPAVCRALDKAGYLRMEDGERADPASVTYLLPRSRRDDQEGAE